LSLKWCTNRVDRLVVKYESEWGGQMSKWDALDPLMHDGLPYWKAEKERIERLQMWDPCAAALQPVSTPNAYHVHPVGIVGNFRATGFKCVNCGADIAITSHVLTALFPRIKNSNAEIYSTDLTKAFKRHNANTCARVYHFLGQASVECTDFTSFEESLVYRDGHRLWGGITAR
jgi:hypothetical protein